MSENNNEETSSLIREPFLQEYLIDNSYLLPRSPSSDGEKTSLQSHVPNVTEYI